MIGTSHYGDCCLCTPLVEKKQTFYNIGPKTTKMAFFSQSFFRLFWFVVTFFVSNVFDVSMDLTVDVECGSAEIGTCQIFNQNFLLLWPLVQISVTRFGKKLFCWQKINFGQFFKANVNNFDGLFPIRNFLTYFFVCYWANFSDCKWPNIGQIVY